MSLSSEFDDILERDFPLRKVTSLGIGGPAEMLARPRSVGELGHLLARGAEEGLPVRVLGAGSNILVADEGVKGLVVKLSGREFARLEHLPGALRCGAGLGLPRLVREAAEAGLSGFEGLAGIPASVGGALITNAGGRYGAIGDQVEEIEALDLGGKPVSVSAQQAGFAYRKSDLSGLVVTSCRLRATPDSPESVADRTREVVREKRAGQPLKAASAGCVFRNPPDGAPAGKLIDELGLKGRRVGGAAISDVHANYIVNDGEARCGDVLELIDAVREAVSRERGVHLDLEIEIWS